MKQAHKIDNKYGTNLADGQTVEEAIEEGTEDNKPRQVKNMKVFDKTVHKK